MKAVSSSHSKCLWLNLFSLRLLLLDSGSEEIHALQSQSQVGALLLVKYNAKGKHTPQRKSGWRYIVFHKQERCCYVWYRNGWRRESVSPGPLTLTLEFAILRWIGRPASDKVLSESPAFHPSIVEKISNGGLWDISGSQWYLIDS